MDRAGCVDYRVRRSGVVYGETYERTLEVDAQGMELLWKRYMLEAEDAHEDGGGGVTTEIYRCGGITVVVVKTARWKLVGWMIEVQQ